MFLLVLAQPGSPGQRAVKWLCVCVCLLLLVEHLSQRVSSRTAQEETEAELSSPVSPRK